jgi:cholesterol oxidase
VNSGYPQNDNGKDKQMNKISDYFGDVERFDPQLSVEPRRELRVGKAEQVYFTTTDGVQIRLTRYQGGGKGPVILSHCIGVSSLMYAIDTIDENLLEYLYRHGFDVWLLDHRLSIELPASYQQSSMDDVATKDYPAAVKKYAS